MKSIITSLLFYTSFAASAIARDCNGHTELCSRKYSNVSFVGAHDSPFVASSRFMPGPASNQIVKVAEQLDAGVRFLTAQTHKSDHDKDAIKLCHTSCLLKDVGSLSNFLSTVKSWMDSHADEVVTLLVTNEDAIDVGKFGDSFKKAGLDTMAYVPPAGKKLEDWPTLEEMISTGKRLVVFMDYHADTSKVEYIADEFQYMFETAFDPGDLTKCDVDRPTGASATDGLMSLVNHNLNFKVGALSMPAYAEASSTNSVSAVVAHADLCAKTYGRMPNVILVDYVGKGDVKGAQNALNHL